MGRSDGESLLGDLFHVAFEARSRYDLDRSDARPWLYGIAANLVMKHLRTEGRHRSALERLASRGENAPSPFDERVTNDAANAQLWSEVAEVICDLPDRDREVVLLYAWQELSYAEIAEALDIPVGTVRSRLNRVRTVLRELRAADGEEPDIPIPRASGGTIR